MGQKKVEFSPVKVVKRQNADFNVTTFHLSHWAQDLQTTP